MFPVQFLILLGTIITVNQAEERENKGFVWCCNYPKQPDEYHDLEDKCKLFNATNHLTKTSLKGEVACSVKCRLTSLDLLEEDGKTIDVAKFRKILYQSAADDFEVEEFYKSKMEICQPKQDEYEHFLTGNEKCRMNKVGLLVCTIFENVTDCPASLKTKTTECDNHFRRLRVAVDTFRNQKVDVLPDLFVNSVFSLEHNLV